MPQTVRLDRAPGSELVSYAGHRDGEPVGTIAIPTRDYVSPGLFISMMMTDWSFLPPGKTVSWQIIEGSILPSQRNEMIQRMEGDWILFVDADMAFRPDAVAKIVKTRDEYDLDIVGGLCFQRADPYQPTLYMRESPDRGGYTFMESWDEEGTGVIEVDGTGMAFILIHRRVFEKMVRFHESRPGFTWPSLEERSKMPPPQFFRWTDGFGEDLRFCQDAKAAGCRVFVDTNIPIDHQGRQTVTHKTFLRAMAARPPQDEAARREVNDLLGLPTLSSDDAKVKLGW